jgi:hypothetical protein
MTWGATGKVSRPATVRAFPGTTDLITTDLITYEAWRPR